MAGIEVDPDDRSDGIAKPHERRHVVDALIAVKLKRNPLEAALTGEQRELLPEGNEPFFPLVAKDVLRLGGPGSDHSVRHCIGRAARRKGGHRADGRNSHFAGHSNGVLQAFFLIAIRWMQRVAVSRNFTAGLHIFLFFNNNLVRTKRDSYWEQFFRIISKIRRSLYEMNHQVDKSSTNFSKFADFTWEHLSGITSSGIRVSDSNSTTFSPMIPFCSV